MERCTKCGYTDIDTELRGEEVTIVCKHCNAIRLKMWF